MFNSGHLHPPNLYLINFTKNEKNNKKQNRSDAPLRVVGPYKLPYPRQVHVKPYATLISLQVSFALSLALWDILFEEVVNDHNYSFK